MLAAAHPAERRRGLGAPHLGSGLSLAGYSIVWLKDISMTLHARTPPESESVHVRHVHGCHVTCMRGADIRVPPRTPTSLRAHTRRARTQQQTQHTKPETHPHTPIQRRGRAGQRSKPRAGARASCPHACFSLCDGERGAQCGYLSQSDHVYAYVCWGSLAPSLRYTSVASLRASTSAAVSPSRDVV